MNKKIILLVDDDIDIREALQDALEYEGFDVVTAIHGKNAIDILNALPKKRLPHLILLDLMMPVMDGHQFMKCMGTEYHSVFCMIPIIVFSAQMYVAVNGPKAPTAILKKPVNLDDLLIKIRTLSL